MQSFSTNDNKEQKLTIKQRLWIKGYLETGNATEAAMQVYNCKERDSAAQIGYENLRKLDFAELLEEAGVSDKILLTVLIASLGGTKLISARNTNQTANELTNNFIDILN